MRTIIAGGLVLDCTGREALPGGVVAIEEGRIVAVGTAADFGSSIAAGEVIDAAGCTVLPGLVDGHVHLLSLPRRSRFTEGEAALWGASFLRAALQGGVTTVRDMGGQYDAIFALRRAVAEGWIVGPRLLTAGRAICMTGGHGHDVFSVEADGPEGVRRAARRQIKAGADLVKLMATGGAGTPGVSPTACQLTLEEMCAAVEEAHKAGRPAAAHAIATRGIESALLAGVDSLEHGVFLDDGTLELMVRKSVVLSPTLSVYVRVLEARGTGAVPDYLVANAVPLVDAHRRSFRRALEAGVKIVLGTDAGTRHHPLGDAAVELELWVRAGMDPRVALQAATRESASACGLGAEVGTLESGKHADLLIVEGDALADIGALNHIRWVMRDGKTVFSSDPGWVSLPGRPVLGPRPGM